MFDMREFKRRHLGAAAKSAAVPSSLTRAEWDRRDPHGWRRAEEAELGLEVEYSDEPRLPEPPPRPARPAATLRDMVRPRETPKAAPPPPLPKPQRPRRFRVLRHLARCSNCGSGTCPNAAKRADWTCIHWFAASGVTVNWNDYEEVKK